ncbi:hypothetical protein [Nocardioides sp. cx-173]|uniref:hypothetical protein n=1 Tax=Nocardioides sp. cx-173 TaxID=2898796 RepID=UPI001E3DC03E|nr:hypothetical protein [Nocardioides sp. cx-173]MCD4524363.1 hypothetical protein [Nocardioides sp. cx-173]UGB43149.1 hypothetical protein LQ940_06380 [Nocardioides sp. cx-173]
MRFRKLAGLSAGALTLGMLSVPMLMAPAHAAVSSTAQAVFTCGTGTQTSTYDATITFSLAHDNGGAKLSATFTDMPNGAPPRFVNFPGATISNKLTVTSEGADVVLTGSHTADFVGGKPTKMPKATGSLATRPSSISIKSYYYKVDKADGTGQAAAQDCTLSAPVTVSFADEPQLAGVNATCTVDMTESGFGGKSSYPAKLELAATMPATGTVGTALSVPVTTTLTFGREFSDYIQTSPVKKVTGAVTPGIAAGPDSAAGSVPLSTWDRTLTPGGTGIGQPVPEFISLTGEGAMSLTPSAAGTHAVTLAGAAGVATMTVTFGDAVMDAPLECGLTTAQAMGSLAVAEAGPTPACTKAQADVKTADAAVTKAENQVTQAKKAVTKAKASVKKAQAKVTKLSKKKQTPAVKRQLKAAKKQLKAAKAKVAKANKQLTTAKKQLTTAKQKLAAANAAVKAEC